MNVCLEAGDKKKAGALKNAPASTKRSNMKSTVRIETQDGVVVQFLRKKTRIDGFHYIFSKTESWLRAPHPAYAGRSQNKKYAYEQAKA